jgi:hypothetical protein
VIYRRRRPEVVIDSDLRHERPIVVEAPWLSSALEEVVPTDTLHDLVIE